MIYMTRGARGEGKVRKRKDGRYEARVMLGYGQDGKEIRRTIYGTSKEEVRKKRRELLVQYEAGQLVNAPSIKFGDWIIDFLTKHAKISTELTTWENYVSVAENNIIPALGRVMFQADDQTPAGPICGKDDRRPKTRKRRKRRTVPDDYQKNAPRMPGSPRSSGQTAYC